MPNEDLIEYPMFMVPVDTLDKELRALTLGPGRVVVRVPPLVAAPPAPPSGDVVSGIVTLSTNAYGASRPVDIPYQRVGKSVQLFLPDLGYALSAPGNSGFDLGVLPVELRPNRAYSAPCFVLGMAAFTPTATRVLAYGEVYANGYVSISSNGNGNAWPNAGSKELVSFVLPYMTA